MTEKAGCVLFSVLSVLRLLALLLLPSAAARELADGSHPGRGEGLPGGGIAPPAIQPTPLFEPFEPFEQFFVKSRV